MAYKRQTAPESSFFKPLRKRAVWWSVEGMPLLALLLLLIGDKFALTFALLRRLSIVNCRRAALLEVQVQLWHGKKLF